MKARACVYCKKQGIFWGGNFQSFPTEAENHPAGHAPQGAVWQLDVRGDFVRNTGRGGIWGRLEFSIQKCTSFVQLHWLDFNKNHTSGHRYRNSRLCQKIFVLMGLIGCDTSNHWLLLGPATGRWDASKDRLQPGGDRFGLLYWCSLI